MDVHRPHRGLQTEHFLLLTTFIHIEVPMTKVTATTTTTAAVDAEAAAETTTNPHFNSFIEDENSNLNQYSKPIFVHSWLKIYHESTNKNLRISGRNHHEFKNKNPRISSKKNTTFLIFHYILTQFVAHSS